MIELVSPGLKNYLIPREEISMISPVMTLIPLPKQQKHRLKLTCKKVGKVDQCKHNAAKQQLMETEILAKTQQIKDSDDQADKLGKIEPVKGQKIRMKMVRTAPIGTGKRELMRIEETFQFKRDVKDENI